MFKLGPNPLKKSEKQEKSQIAILSQEILTLFFFFHEHYIPACDKKKNFNI